MARITIEDVLEKEGNRFILARLAAMRAYQLMRGAKPLIENKDMNGEIVLALREIAEGVVCKAESSEEQDEKWIITKPF